uniref:Uncharacterized protein n=1 Tax=Parascaris equorum TaxID=6256 RepID=A0A914S377_PAREQ
METRDKATRECQRLREHLLAVEDASTKEAVLAEERETELRRRVRELEAKTEATADTVIQSTNTYQVSACTSWLRECDSYLFLQFQERLAL